MKLLEISEVAKLSGVSASALRYYESRNLISSVGRRGLRRLFEPVVLDVLDTISLAKWAGFSLDEIAGLLEITGERYCEQTRQLTERKLVDVRLRIRELRQLERDLEQKIARCAQVPAGECCPTLDFLERPRKPAATGS